MQVVVDDGRRPDGCGCSAATRRDDAARWMLHASAVRWHRERRRRGAARRAGGARDCTRTIDVPPFYDKVARDSAPTSARASA